MQQLLRHAYSEETPKNIQNHRYQQQKHDQISEIIRTDIPSIEGQTNVIDPMEIKVLETLTMTPMGTVSKVLYRRKHYILKERKYSELGKGKSVMHELNIFEKVSKSCKYIVKLEGYFRKDRSICMLLEEASNGDLYTIIQKRKEKGFYFEESEILSVITGIATALNEIHKKQIIHRDLKSLNVFIDAEGVVKVGDFGISRSLSNETIYVQTYSLGTPLYLSAEVIENRPYNEKVDIWALGIILFELLTCGDYPFEGRGLRELMHKISQGTFQIPSFVSSTYSTGIVNLLQHMLRKDFSRRPTASEVLDICKLLGHKQDVDIVEPLRNPSQWKRIHSQSFQAIQFTSGNIRYAPATKNISLQKCDIVPASNQVFSRKDEGVVENSRAIHNKLNQKHSQTMASPVVNSSENPKLGHRVRDPSPIPPDLSTGDFPFQKQHLVLHRNNLAQNLKQNHLEWPKLKQETFTIPQASENAKKNIEPQYHKSHNSLKQKMMEGGVEDTESEPVSLPPTNSSRRNQRWEQRYNQLLKMKLSEGKDKVKESQVVISPIESPQTVNKAIFESKTTADRLVQIPQPSRIPHHSKVEIKTDSEMKPHTNVANEIKSSKLTPSEDTEDTEQFYRKSINNRAMQYEPVRRFASNQNAVSKRYNILLELKYLYVSISEPDAIEGFYSEAERFQKTKEP